MNKMHQWNSGNMLRDFGMSITLRTGVMETAAVPDLLSTSRPARPLNLRQTYELSKLVLQHHKEVDLCDSFLFIVWVSMPANRALLFLGKQNCGVDTFLDCHDCHSA